MIMMLAAVCGFSMIAQAGAPNGISGNGTGGIYIDVNAAPFTTYASRTPNYDAYGPSGCGWFASARAHQITGKSSPIWNHNGWWNTGAAKMGYTKGTTPQAPALICWGGHIAVLEKISGNTAIISEGGYSPAKYAANGYTKISQVSLSSIPGRNSGFKGYVYLKGSKPTNSNVSYSGCKTEWTDTWNAGLYGHINNPNGYQVTYVGAYIWKVEGGRETLVVNHTEWCGLSYKSFDQRLNVVAEAKASGLAAGSYRWQFWAQTSIDKKYSAKGSFTIKSKEASKKSQTISASNQRKAVGDKAFTLKVKRTGNGKLSYSSSNAKVAAINSKGVVTVKGIGTTTITIKAAATSTYKAASKKITITVVPKKPAMKARNVIGKKLLVTWNRQSGITGYQVQVGTTASFARNATYKVSASYTGCSFRATKGTTYYVRVRAYKGNLYSAWSTTQKVKINW